MEKDFIESFQKEFLKHVESYLNCRFNSEMAEFEDELENITDEHNLEEYKANYRPNFDTLFNNCFSGDYSDETIRGIDFYPTRGNWHTGASKFVFVPNDEDFVIKIVFDEYNLRRGEIELYQSAKRKGLEKFFAKSYSPFSISGTIHNYDDSESMSEYTFSLPCYFQEKKKDNYLSKRIKKNFFYDSAYRREEIKSKNSKMKETWIKKCARQFDREGTTYRPIYESEFFPIAEEILPFGEIKELIAFLAQHGINDLHTGNFIIEKSVPIFFDYSGYGSSSSY